MKYQHLMLSLLICLLAINLPSVADDSPVDPTQTIADQVLQGVVTGVRGMVQIRQSEDDPWVKAETGMELSQGAEFRTGPRSAVQFKIPPDQTITLDRLGTVKLLTAVAENNKIKTDIGMTYGRTRYDIRKAGFEHESTIRSPSATLSVRGTRVGIQDGAMGFVAWSTESRARVFDQNRRQTMTFGEDTGVDSESQSPADNKKKSGQVDPGDNRGRDGGEDILVFNQPGHNPNPGGGLPIFGPGGPRKMGPVIPNNPDFLGLALGQLRFELSWSVYTPGDYADLDLWVKSPAPGDVTIGTFDHAKHNLSGGVAGQDFVSDGVGEGEYQTFYGTYVAENVRWDGPTFPLGKYTVGVDGFSIHDGDGEPTSVDYTLTVQTKKNNEEYFNTIHYIYDNIHDNQTHEHDIVVAPGLQSPSETE
ncbi:MAG: hypothetical protein CMJ19_12695 [Phycisphaeraceae bacterium]|nr:hypothetical protein [Phycisphaeraceae bacterium]